MSAALAGILSAVACGGQADLGGTTPLGTCPADHSDGGVPVVEAGSADAPDARTDERAQPVVDASVDIGESGDAPGSIEAASGDAPGSIEAASADVPAVVTYPSHCSNGKLDETETAVDCGGVCDGCGPGLPCDVDTDCSATASGCDPSQGGCACDGVSGLCIYSHCFDHKLDYGESDVDCGGPCSPCVIGKVCLGDDDCALQACDGISMTCVMDPCADHRRDGHESDVDCGGNCTQCLVGMHCNVNSDCAPGHVCNSQKVCQ